MYELLPTSKRSNFDEAAQALSERLYPIESEALVSAQLMRSKQQSHESADDFAQDLEKFFERSYGCRRGMDEASKALLKRDVFVQGLLLQWQKKVLPLASTYSDALHQARAGGHTLKSYRHEANKWVGGLEANFHKRSLCVKFSHNTCTAL